MGGKNGTHQPDLHGQSFVGSAALQLLQGFALVWNRWVIVFVRTGWVSMALTEAGVRAPVGQTVASTKVIDGE